MLSLAGTDTKLVLTDNLSNVASPLESSQGPGTEIIVFHTLPGTPVSWEITGKLTNWISAFGKLQTSGTGTIT